MGWERSFAFIGILIAIVFVLENINLLGSRRSPAQGPKEHVLAEARPGAKVTKIALCILTRRSEWQRRHLARQTWLQDVPDGAQVSHIFVMGEDQSYTPEENARLAAEAQTNRDILIAPVEEASDTVAAKTKHCIEWTTKNHDFDVLVKADDDSTLFMSRLFGDKGWLPPRAVIRGELVYFGKRHALTKVANPANFRDSPTTKNGQSVVPAGTAAAVTADVDGLFEFDYRGIYWPEHMEGGMYGLSRALAEEIANNDFRTYSSEAATVGVWVSAFPANALYLADGRVLSDEADYLASNGTVVAASFRTCRVRQASMWCEYTAMGTLSPRSILAQDVPQALDCLGSYERASFAPRSLPLGTRESYQAALRKSLGEWRPITEQPNVEETGRWWRRMGGAFRGKPAAVVGMTTTTVDRLPLYLLEGMHTLVMNDFFRFSERYPSWKPTMYMCVDPEICASRDGRGGSGGSVDLRGKVQGQREAVPRNVESANKFARDVFAAFYMLNSGAEYWRYLRQRVNAHWFMAGGGGRGGGAGRTAGVGFGGDNGIAGGMGRAGVADKSAENFRSVSQTSGLAMAVEVLSFLGFSPIYVVAAKEELGGGRATQQWDEFSVAVKLAGSSYGTSVIYLYADDEDKLPNGKLFQQPRSRGRGKAAADAASAAAAGKFSSQEHFTAWAKTRNYAFQAQRPANWDLEMFLQHFPVVSRLKIVRNASSVEAMFPSAPVCRDAQDLDRFARAVRCPVKISLKHFSSFLAWHVPYGPVRGMFVWVKR